MSDVSVRRLAALSRAHRGSGGRRIAWRRFIGLSGGLWSCLVWSVGAADLHNVKDAEARLRAIQADMVKIPNKPWRMGKYAVTFEQWDACVAIGGCNGYSPNDEGWGRGRRPVINVTWADAQAFIRFVNQTTRHHYRLPSEAEWEYATLGDTTTDYYWVNAKTGSGHGEDDLDVGHANCVDCGSQWDGKKTAPVGSFAPNPYGLYDMLGNVWQWTDGCDETCSRHYARGGSWHSFAGELRVNYHIRYTTPKRFNFNGFRLIEDL